MNNKKAAEKKIAKLLFKSSLSEGQLNMNKIHMTVKGLKNYEKGKSPAILNMYISLIKKYEKANTLVVESSVPLKSNLINNLRILFEKSQGKNLQIVEKPNQSLLGGVCVTLGDFQWDLSLKGKLQILEAKLNA